jgi:hypothetical protein
LTAWRGTESPCSSAADHPTSSTAASTAENGTVSCTARSCVHLHHRRRRRSGVVHELLLLLKERLLHEMLAPLELKLLLLIAHLQLLLHLLLHLLEFLLHCSKDLFRAGSKIRLSLVIQLAFEILSAAPSARRAVSGFTEHLAIIFWKYKSMYGRRKYFLPFSSKSS